jgi:Protein involved in formate dehydrogenase formation
MPYIPVPPLPRAALLQEAEQRWKDVVEGRPDLAPAIALQKGLLTLVVDLSRQVTPDRLPRLSLPPRYLAAKLARGVPAFAGEPIPLPVALLKPLVLSLCDELAAGGAGDAATHIREAIDSGSIETGSLLTASLARDQGAIRTGASHRGLSPDLVWLVAELAVSPVAYALQRMLFANTASVETKGATAAAWNHGYCPACGSWPALAEIVDAHRTLRCSFCAAAWELTTHACVYCEEAGEPFVTVAPDAAREDRRLELCSSCGSYLKTLDLGQLSPFPLLAIADLATMDLDVAAMEHQFGRPPLKEFAVRK